MESSGYFLQRILDHTISRLLSKKAMVLAVAVVWSACLAVACAVGTSPSEASVAILEAPPSDPHCPSEVLRPWFWTMPTVVQVDHDGIPNHYVQVDHAKLGYMVRSPLPHETLNLLELPDSFDWRNVGGVSYVSVARYLGVYCSTP